VRYWKHEHEMKEVFRQQQPLIRVFVSLTTQYGMMMMQRQSNDDDKEQSL